MSPGHTPLYFVADEQRSKEARKGLGIHTYIGWCTGRSGLTESNKSIEPRLSLSRS